MNKIDRYIQAATRDNTRRSYQSAVRHFEEEWGGFLPATPENLALYLADFAEMLATSTLKQRLAALAQWHIEQGFPDPTKSALVRKVLKGIRELHPAIEKQAKPFQIDQLRELDNWLSQQIQIATEAANQEALMRYCRDRALILLGFWRGMRSDELCRLQTEHIHLYPGEGMTLFLPRSKGDRQSEGRTFKAPALQQLCPVEASQQWLSVSGITEGPLFRRIDRWGALGANSLHPNSIIPLLRSLFTEAKLADPNTYSSHSLRRGFASWANSNGWDMKSLMSYVGWKDIKSAMRYLDVPNSFKFEPQLKAQLAGSN